MRRRSGSKYLYHSFKAHSGGQMRFTHLSAEPGRRPDGELNLWILTQKQRFSSGTTFLADRYRSFSSHEFPVLSCFSQFLCLLIQYINQSLGYFLLCESKFPQSLKHIAFPIKLSQT